jgi:hypothetical protein
VEYEIEEPWTVTLAYTSRDGALTLAAVYVFPTVNDPADRSMNPNERERDWGEWRQDTDLVPPGGLSIRKLRDLNTSAALSVALANVPRPGSGLAAAGFVAAGRAAARPRQEPALLARVAVLYEQAREEGRQPNPYIFERLQEPPNQQVAKRTVADLIRQARAAGFLPPTTQGRASGRATQAAHDLLREHKR